MNKIIAVDFDGTLCENKWPEIGEPKQKVIDYILAEQKKGAKLILWTSRTGKRIVDAIDWCTKRGIFFDAVNTNVEEIVGSFEGESRKIFATEYIDDKAVTPEMAANKYNPVYEAYARLVKVQRKLDTHHYSSVVDAFNDMLEVLDDAIGYLGEALE